MIDLLWVIIQSALYFLLPCNNGIFSAPKCFSVFDFFCFCLFFFVFLGEGRVLSLSMFVWSCWWLVFSFPNMLVNMKCAGTSLLWAECVFRYTAVGFTEALKPFVGLFNNSSIVSFALVQGIDPGSLCVIEFLCRCCITNLVPHHCWVEGQLQRWITGVCLVCLHSLEIESKGATATWQIHTELLMTFSYSY